VRKIKNYFKALKSHPGVPTAITLTCIYMFIGATSTTFEDMVNGAILGLLGSSIFWIILLISNIGRDPEE
jgi:hypothetical protein